MSDTNLMTYFLDQLVIDTENMIKDLENEIDRDIINGLSMSYLLAIYNKSTNQNMKRINIKNKTIYLMPNHTSENRDWTFFRTAYMDYRKKQKEKNDDFYSKYFKLEYENKDLKEKNEKLKQEIVKLQGINNTILELIKNLIKNSEN
jgi:hypothetical protein